MIEIRKKILDRRKKLELLRKKRNSNKNRTLLPKGGSSVNERSAELITTRSLALHNFFTLKGLSMQMGGCEPENIPRFCMKELIDNALDASGKKPEITIGLEDMRTLKVRDRGPGISRENLHSLLKYDISTSSKFHYIRETRGALGNALHCVFAAPYVLAQQKNIELTEPWIKICSRGVEYSIGFKVEWHAQTIKPQVKEWGIEEDEGTEISVTFPEDVTADYWLFNLAKEFALFNPNSCITYSTKEDEEILMSDAKANVKLLGHSNIHYYTQKEFMDLLVAKARDGMLLREFIAKFKLFKSDYKYVKEIIREVWAENPPTYLNDFSHDREKIERLQESMRRFSPVPESKDLGKIGRSNIKRFVRTFYYPDEKGFWYVAKKGVLDDDYRLIPYMVEVALAYLEEGEGGVHVGFNRSPCIDVTSFIARGKQQDWVDSKGKRVPGLPKRKRKKKSKTIAVPHGVFSEYGFDYRSPDAVLVIHISCPCIKYENYGKTDLDTTDQVTNFLVNEMGVSLIDVFSNYYKYKRKQERKQLRLKLSQPALAEKLIELQKQIDFKLSARGWCYMLEGLKVINKGQFDQTERIINKCRKDGLLPIDFVAEDEGRSFIGVEVPEGGSPIVYFGKQLKKAMAAEEYYTPDWWEGEKYYIQMLVEKIDLKTLFQPICKKYHIPIATSKGWSSILQRDDMADRFKKAEERGLRPILLYYGDHDPWGLEISNRLLKNLKEIQKGTRWNPRNLIIDRFGLNFDFIEKLHLTWIDNLITSSGREPDRNNPIVKRYTEKFGERKCEANALVVRPKEAEELCRMTIEKYLGSNALERFEAKRERVREILREFKDRTRLTKTIMEVIGSINGV